MEKGNEKDKTIEDTNQKKLELKEILSHPDEYIGSVEHVTEPMWIYDQEEERMIQREITYVPGLYKIYDEILVNAADSIQRDPTIDKIKIDIKQEDNTISVWYNGHGIPVAVHREENMYALTKIFDHLTSSNYDDAENKATGGRNGYGGKLCNIFSGRFVFETSSKELKKSFKQTWANNMSKCIEVSIKESSDEDFTKVTFSPDLEKFKMTQLDDDIVSLMTRRAYDCAASTKGVGIYLNDTLIPIEDFEDYCELFIKGRTDDSDNPLKLSYERCGLRWEVAVALSPNYSFKQMSFVNSIATTKGGKHVDYVSDAIVEKLQDTLKKENKEGAQLDKKSIKQHMWIFINCLITNPTFDSQTKENMILVSKFDSKYEVTDEFITRILKLGIIESTLHWAKFKPNTQLQKLTGGSPKKKKIFGIPRLDDAYNAGTSKSIDCTLILTGNDSGECLARCGVGSLDKGRVIFGIYSLNGKLLNVRETTDKQISENDNINNLMKILGLQYQKKYETQDDLKTLRYGKLMIMTDQDQHGTHLKGLLINFIHHNWPSLLKLNFIDEFITPLIKVTKGSEKLSFYSTAEYEKWHKDQPAPNKIKPKYYKNLGTSTLKEAREYFSNMQKHRIAFTYAGDEDDKNIVMAFSEKCRDQRKDWLTNYMTTTKDRKERGLGEKFLYHENIRSVTYTDFINVELVSCLNYDNVRSIPNVIDGLKPEQRRVMYICMLRNDKNEVNVAQLGASVAEKCAYYHQHYDVEQLLISLSSTIVHLAQDFVGSNNINLLLPIGLFGSRICGSEDAASPRYIFTKLNPLTRLIFHEHDDPLLQHEISYGKKNEPTFYVPIIPMILVNGAEGIGTEWMTKIPNHNPREIIQNLFNMMDGNDIQPMKPYWKNFKGEIEPLSDTCYVIYGEILVIGNDKIKISELPIGTWIQHYKETVLDVMASNKNIVDYKESETHFIVTLTPQQLRDYERDGFYKVFKLQTTISMSSMFAFDKHLCLSKYDDINRIMREFYDLRLEFYVKRKNYLTSMLEAEARKLTNQARFILEICDGILVIYNKKEKAVIDELIAMGYDSDPVSAWKVTQKNSNETIEDDEETDETNETRKTVGFDYLLDIGTKLYTKEKIDELLKKRDDKKTELDILLSKTPKSIWKDDLDALFIALNDFEEK
ncbi:DNA topoisomerase 2-like [Aphidius gifuensis]|uniref:DNA topoisomerase 2-like n=1 Tax=Aphidius gifuensis TaxID=684658 RepID=UPI001CDCFCE9|nr:DNA topoisomerase 2-like [Aphidius gifuensis]